MSFICFLPFLRPPISNVYLLLTRKSEAGDEVT